MKLALLTLLRTVMLLKHNLSSFLSALFCINNCVFTDAIIKAKHVHSRFPLDSNPGRAFSGLIRNTLVSILLLVTITTKLMAEGTKQLEPLNPGAANGYCKLALFKGGMTFNGYRIPFAAVGCAPAYRLNIHIADPANEKIYFGFKQRGGCNLFYQLRDPNGNVVIPLTSQPTIGNPGYINTWNNAVGPLPMVAGGYTPLTYTPLIAGDYYIEFAQDNAGNTFNWTDDPASASAPNPCNPIIEFFDISVFDGITAKPGRLWSKAWQFYDFSQKSQKTNFYVYSNDSIVTKLNINNWKGGHYIFYCNEWGAVTTGNWYTDRQSVSAWPGDLPEYKEFLSDPDNIVYPTGSFGNICDVQTNSKCDGSVEFQVKVNKAGKIDMSIDIPPLGIDNGEDVKINADVTGSLGCTTWETINWDGKNGFGQLLVNGATASVTINYLNGLTHLPIYDIETNNNGIMVDLVRPAPIGSPKLNIYWDDTKIPGGSSNFTGCTYIAPNGCHTWPNGDYIMFNAWWYYLADVKNTSPVIRRLPETPTASPAGPVSICSGQANVVYTIAPIQFADSYVWTLPDGSTVITAANSITLSFPSVASGGTLMVHGENANCTGGDSPALLITVNPTPVATATPGIQTICSGETTSIALGSNVPNTTFTWIIGTGTPASVTGFYPGSANAINQTLVNSSNASHDVTYIITPTSGGCIGAPITVVVTVQPANMVSSLPLAQTICSGTTFNMNLTATLPGTDFSWTVSGTGITGFRNSIGFENTISQTLTNNTSSPASAIYLVKGTINGCTTSTTIYTVTVNNLPTQYPLSGGGEYCSGGTGDLVGLTGSQPGVSYQLYNNGNPVGNIVAGTGSPIDFGYQTLAGTYTASGTRIADNCYSDMSNNVNVTINPLPIVNAGPDLNIPYGISTTLNGSVSGGTGASNYSWSPLSNIANGSTTLNPLTTNLYSVTTFTLTAIDTKGCKGSDPVKISLSGSALSITASSNPIQICKGSQTQISSIASGGSGFYSFKWTSIPSGSPVWTSSLQSPWVTPDVTTMYIVEVNDGYNKSTASVLVIVNPLPIQYDLTGGGSYCNTGTGIPLGLSGSQNNTAYQLLNGGIPDGPVVYGNGGPISFGDHTAAPAYTVVATNIATGCVNLMNGSVMIALNPLPTIYKIDPIGQQCPGTIIRLNGSDAGIKYYLLLDGVPVDSISGTGIIGFLDFGPRSINGTYTVMAVDIVTGCNAMMNGSTYINVAPQVYNVIPAGILCPGQMISLSGSEVGVSYQLRWNGTFDLGLPVPGTGSPLALSVGSLPGVYTVIGIDDNTHCVSYMNDSATLYPNPVIFTIVPDGEACEGNDVILNGSETGVDYILILDNAIHVDTIHGTGSVINFGAQLTAGNYTIEAVIQNSYCITQMNGVAIIDDSPIKYNINPAGIVCTGNSIGLDGSQVGVTYQLLLNGTINMGLPVAGTGSPVSFGAQTIDGAYSVRAVNNVTGCNAIMEGISDLVPLPVAYQVAPAGNHCAGTSISLTNSETNFNYILILNGSINIDTIAGTGAGIDFGPQITAGTYTIAAFSSSTFCFTNMSGSSIIDARPIQYNLTPAGFACSGDALGLTNSETGVTYQLRRDGITNVGAIVSGTGSAISFGVQNIPGIYSIEAVGSNGCHAIMADSVTLQPHPIAFTVLPAGIHCPGTDIYLNGSETGINYILLRDGAIAVDTIAGTGGILDFGTPMIAGTYSVIAYTTAALCQNVMNGSSLIMSSPTLFNITPAGINCIGSSIGLDNSETGVNYQLRRDGITNIGVPVAGNGSAISFGEINIPGIYTVIATNTLNGCGNSMSGNVVLKPVPLIYTLAPQGIQCAGSTIMLNGSQTGTDYVLIRDNTFNVDTISGTGSALDFGPQFITGNYTIAAIAGVTSCRNLMTGSTDIIGLPAAFNITPAGINCGTANIGLDGSETGVNYTLFKNGVNTGITISGTGNAITFGTQTYGNYTIKAYNLISSCNLFIPGTLQIGKPAVVNSGSDVTICSSQPVFVSGTVSNGGATTWSTSGDGTFSTTNTLSAIYTPGNDDMTAGNVYLMLSTNGKGSCATTQVIDTLKVTLDHFATAAAGGNHDVCVPGPYTVSGASATNYNSVSWSTSGSGTILNGNSLTPTYTPSPADISSGSVKLTMQVTGKSPCSNTATDAITLTFPPIVKVNAGPDATVNYGDVFVASQSSVLNSTSYQWTTSGSGSFNDSSFLHATYTPSNADFAQGWVVLSLSASNNASCAPALDDLTVILTNNWKAEYTWSATCEAQPVVFSVNRTVTNVNAVANWLWDFGDGNTSSQMNPTHLFASVGGYIVTLTATDTLGNIRVVSHNITISQLPVAFFSSSIPNCSNALVHFTDLAHTLYGYIAEWIWNYGDGSKNDTVHFPDEPNVAHLYNAAGTFNVTLTVTNSFGCISSATIPVDVIEAPVANFQYTEDCSGLETAFRDASYANGPGNTVQYWWNFGDPSTGTNNYSDLEDATHTFSAPGIYQVTHVVRNFNNCTDTIVKPVSILIPVEVGFVYDHPCVDGKSNFGPDTSVMNVADITSWAWDFGDGVTNNQEYTNHIYSVSGSYQVTLTVIAASGCTASKSRTVVVNPLPVAMFNTSVLTCENTPMYFDDLSAAYAGHITEWTWDFGDGNTKQISYPANSDTYHTFSAPGSYIVKLSIISSEGCTAERVQTVVIDPAPVVNFDVTNTCQGTQVHFNDLTQTNGAGSIKGWAWNFGDGASGSNDFSVLQNPEHTYQTTGTYQVSLTVSSANGCSSTLVKTVVITNAPLVDFSFDNHCVASSIQFTHSPGMDMANISALNWSFGDGITSTQADPQHLYNNPGDYIVTLKITNTSGCENTISHNITILPAPVANFSIDAPACSKYKVSFTDQSSAPIGSIMRWEYNFGDGTSAVINYPENPCISHTYATYGMYNATLTVVTNDNCSAITSKSIQILQSPLANFDFNSTCLDVPVQFNDLSQGNLISWAWDFNDPGSLLNNSSTLQNPSHLFGQYGDYQVSLFVQSANGCHDTVTHTISISPKPAVDFSFNTGCAADTVHFNSSAFVNVSSTSSWVWQFGDNSTSVDPDPNHIYTSPGTYSVSLTVTNQNGCTNIRTRQVQITTAPVAMFTPNLLSCSGTAVLFTDLSSTPNGIINSWNWNFDDGEEIVIHGSSNGNTTHTYAVAGIYHVTLTIHTTSGCEASYTVAITVNSAPVSAFSSASSCSALPTSFTDLSQGSDGYSIIGWSWNFGDPASGMSNVSALQNPQHLFNSTGIYNVTLTTENALGCTNSITQILNITSGPAVDFTSSSICSNTPAMFSVDANNTNTAEIASYLWNFGDGTSTSNAAEPTHVYSQSGNYLVTLTITNNAGCTNSASHNVKVQASPTPQFSFSGNCASNLVKFTDKSYNTSGEKTVAWAWDFGVSNTTSDVSAEHNPSYTYSEAGTYNVTLTVTSASGCTASKVIPVTIMAAPQAQFSYQAEPCHNGAVIFKDESVSTAQSIITGWHWEFAPGVYSTSQNPTYIFGTSDTCYEVKLTVTTSIGCTNTQIQKVCIPPGIQLAINYTQACFGETTWFTSSLIEPAGGSITSYSWDFGDPATDYNNQSKLANPEHTFSKPGPYYVSLKATDVNGCSTIKYINVNVDLLPKADFSYSGGACDSLVKFKDQTFGINIIRWTWNFGDGKSKTVDSPASPDVTHYYTYPGVYKVTLIAQSEAGCIDTIIKTIRRTPCIAAAFKVSDPVVCVKRTMKFTESSTCQAPIASWTWYFGDNTSTTFTSPQQNVEHTYAVPGNYTVKMVVATQMVGGLATDTASNQVAVKPAARAAYKWQDVCVGSSTTFENQSQNNNTTIKSYQWNFGDPSTTTDTTSAKQAEYKYDVYGAYDVKLVVTNTLGCTDTIINKVNIFESPAADFTWKNNCEAKPVSFIDQSVATSSALVNWNWRFKSDSVVLEGSNQRNCAYKFAHAGTYDAYMKVTDKNGCSTTIAKQVTINTNPVAAFNIIDNYEDKQGQIMLSNGTIDGASYEWAVNDGKTSFGTNPVITFDKEGHYTIQLTASNEAGCTDTVSMSYDLMYKGLYVPNAFNPGNIDPLVAVFKPKGMNLMLYNIGVYDQWGNLLWSSDKLDSKGSPTESWDGTVQGKPLQQDVYVWKVQAQFNDGEIWDGHNGGNMDNMPQKTSGTITLIR